MPSETSPVINIRGLHKSYGDLQVLKGIDITAKRGNVVALIGSSGSGKSTLLRCCNMLETSQEEIPSTSRVSQCSGEAQVTTVVPASDLSHLTTICAPTCGHGVPAVQPLGLILMRSYKM